MRHLYAGLKQLKSALIKRLREYLFFRQELLIVFMNHLINMMRYKLLSFIEIKQNGVLLFLIFLFVNFDLYLF